jgi:uncharacterized protein (TIGR00369 family)
MSIGTMNGLEHMQAIVEGRIPHPSMCKTVSMKAILAEKGKVIYEAVADDRHINPLGNVHGGFAAAVMDSVTGYAIHTMLDAGVGYGTIDLNVKMLRPVPKNTKLIAEGRVLNISKSLGVSEGTLKNEAGKLFAHATAICMILST